MLNQLLFRGGGMEICFINYHLQFGTETEISVKICILHNTTGMSTIAVVFTKGAGWGSRIRYSI